MTVKKRVIPILQGIVSLIMHVAFYVVLHMELYTDRAMMANGQVREWHRSPIARLRLEGRSGLLYLQLAFAAASVVAGILIWCGVKNSAVKRIWIACTAASAIVFIVIMIASGNKYVSYV